MGWGSPACCNALSCSISWINRRVMSSMFVGWPFEEETPLSTTPYPTPFADTPALGAMVTDCPCCLGIITSQFSGRWSFTGPRSAATMRWLGRTLSSGTEGEGGVGGAAGDEPLALVTAAPVGLNVAPFFLLKPDHWPDFAPCAISSPV